MLLLDPYHEDSLRVSMDSSERPSFGLINLIHAIEVPFSRRSICRAFPFSNSFGPDFHKVRY